MFNRFPNRSMGKAIISGLIAFNSLSAQATLTSYNSNGVDLVYSSVSDVTWTKDANLLGTMMAEQGYTTIVNAIIALTPIIYNDPDLFDPFVHYHSLSAVDFKSDDLGRTSWYGALAFVNYLNDKNYGGSSEWRLPTTKRVIFNPTDALTIANGIDPGEEYAELSFSELRGEFNQPIVDQNNIFYNDKAYFYWTGSEYWLPNSVYSFDMTNGIQSNYRKVSNLFYAWAISPGQISAVPEPKSQTLLLAGLVLLGISKSWNKEHK